jgi:hypothetical protein
MVMDVAPRTPESRVERGTSVLTGTHVDTVYRLERHSED